MYSLHCMYRPFDPEVPSSAAISEIQQELRDMKSEFWN